MPNPIVKLGYKVSLMRADKTTVLVQTASPLN